MKRRVREAERRLRVLLAIAAKATRLALRIFVKHMIDFLGFEANRPIKIVGVRRATVKSSFANRRVVRRDYLCAVAPINFVAVVRFRIVARCDPEERASMVRDTI